MGDQSNKTVLKSKRLITCTFSDGTEQKFEEGILYHFGFYQDMYVNLNLRELSDAEIGAVPLPLSPNIFTSIVEWVENHREQIELEMKVNPMTRELVWLQFTDFQKAFFSMAVVELIDLIKAVNFLNYNHLYKYSCQQLAKLIIRAGTPEKCRELLNIADDLTAAEKAELNRSSVWCKY